MSTDKLDQINSLESQQRFFYEYIAKNPEWELSEIYVDEGITGTNTYKRGEFNRMISDGKDGKIDIIITKEVSRFARNLLDSIAYTRELREYGIRILFMNDNIDTDQPDHEFRLAMMASLAQEESRKISERVRWGQRRQMEKGVVFGRDMLGYDVRGGKLLINEEGAEVVKLIFHKYLDEGKGCHVIADELRRANIKGSRFMNEWSFTSVLRVLKNEKYCGDLVQQKTYTKSFLSHKKTANKGELEYVTIRNHHEPIIPRERFEAAQRELERRRGLHYQKIGFTNRYALSGKIICAECGSGFVHIQKKHSNGGKFECWCCAAKYKKTSGKTCSNVNVRDEDIKNIIMMISGELFAEHKEITDSVIKQANKVLHTDCGAQTEKCIQKIKVKKERLLDMYLSGIIDIAEYQNAFKKIEKDISILTDKEKKNYVVNISEIIYNVTYGKEWNEFFYRNIIDKIYIHKDRTADVYLKHIDSVWRAKILLGKAEIEAFNKNSD